jgi:UDP:flavonoid glycosyltransferase YjiC (YdhE family)
MKIPKRILFATMPMDGHFSPLTSLAVHLKDIGFDVRWYVGGHYGEKVRKLGLHHYPFVKAQTVNQENMDVLFPERATIKGTIARLRFDIKQVFLLRVPEFVDDLTEIHQAWPYDLLIHDVAFFAGPFIKDRFNLKTVSVGVMPLMETDEQLPPSGLGLQPMPGVLGQLTQAALRFLVQKIMLKPSNDLHNQIRKAYGLGTDAGFLFDSVVRTADIYLQSGVPGFEYPRKKISSNVRFVGPLLPYSKAQKRPFDHAAKALTYDKVVLVTQGTVERNIDKLLVPTLEAFKNDPKTLVIATTGGSRTAELRSRFPQDNMIIEDFINFNAVMPYANVYVTNGGYGGVMLGLQHNLPIIAAGVHEGKNEIAARIAYCKVGVDLKTETPKPKAIRQAVDTLLRDETYRQNVRKMSLEFSRYKPNKLAEKYITSLFAPKFEPELATLL